MRELLEALTRDRAALIRRQAEADRVVAASSAGHLVHEMNVGGEAGSRRPWRVDPVPLVLDAATFDRLAAGVADRVAVLERILCDIYGQRDVVRDGVVPGEVLSSTPRYRIGSVGSPLPRRWLTLYAADVVALADGTWRIVRDLTDAPTGIGYALLDRAAMLPALDDVGAAFDVDGDAAVAPLTGVAAELRHALAANSASPSPRIVLLSGGVDTRGYIEDSQLARILGFTLVERPDLVVRQRRLWLRTLGGLDPVDVVYRRVNDDDTDPIEIAAPGVRGVPGLLSAVAAGGVVLANAHGSGVIEEPGLASLWPTAAEALTGTSLRLPHLGDSARSAHLATFPVFRTGELAEAAVVLRLHAIAGPSGVTVVPGGNGRVLAAGDDPQHPTARIVKDVWVLDPARAIGTVVAPLPQVDFAESVPTRAADALFWAGRAAERADAIARTLRAVSTRRRQDPGLVVAEGGRWSRRMAAALRAARDDRGSEPEDSRGAVAWLDAETLAATRALAERLRVFVAEVATVGEFLPASAAGVLTALAGIVDEFAEGRAAAGSVDDVLSALSAFSGLWNESTVRGPAWRLGDVGIRIERALVVLGLVSSLVDVARRDEPVDALTGAVLEVLLSANESLVAYRRQYRSDIALAPALDLLLHDRDNPRGYVACVDRLADDVADITWADGSAAVAQLEALAILLPEDLAAEDDFDRVDEAATAVRTFASLVVDRWFATPVKPMLMRSGRAARL